MPSDKTKIQREKSGDRAKAQYYTNKRRRERIGNKKWWLDAYLGNRDINELWKCYGIKP